MAMRGRGRGGAEENDGRTVYVGNLPYGAFKSMPQSVA